MSTGFYLRKIDRARQEIFKKHLTEKKLNRLTRLLRHGNLEVADFRIAAENSRHRPRYFSVKLALALGRKKLVAEEGGHNLLEVFDLAFDCLVFQARKMEALRHDT